MSSRDRLNYKKAMFNLRRERNIGHHITLQESNSLRLADERMEDELAKNILDFGETEDTVPTREDSIREEIVLEQDVLPVNLATSPDPAVGPTRLPRTGQLTPISGDLPRSTAGTSDANSTNNRPTGTDPIRSARAVYGNLLTNVATLIGRAAEPNSPNTILGALSSTPDNSSTPGTTPAPGATPPTPGTTPAPGATPPAPARAQLSIITGGTQIQRNPPEVSAAGGKMYQLTLTQAGINRGADFNAVLTGIKSHIVRASQNSFGGRAGNINFNNIVQVVGGQGGTVVVRFPWADAQQANLRQKITEALQNAQRGELSRLGQITLIELPGDVRGETAVATGGTGTTPAPAPLSPPLSVPALPGSTGIGILQNPTWQVPSSGIMGIPTSVLGTLNRSLQADIYKVEVRVLQENIQQGYSGPLSQEYMLNSSANIQNALLSGINTVFAPPNSDNDCRINPSLSGFDLTYVPGPAYRAISVSSVQPQILEQLRAALTRASSMLVREIPGANIRFLLPGDPGYETAIPQAGSVETTYGQRFGRAVAGGIQSGRQGAEEIGREILRTFQEQKIVSTRLQQLAGILKEQNVYDMFNVPNNIPNNTSAPVMSSGNATQGQLNYTTGPDVPMSTMPPTAGLTPAARPAARAASRPAARSAAQPAAASTPPNPNVNRMIDQAIQNARRIAPSVAALATNSKYAANRDDLQRLAQYLTGEFVTAMNAAKNAPDTASKLRAVQAVYTPPNRGALLRNGLFALGRLATTERR